VLRVIIPDVSTLAPEQAIACLRNHAGKLISGVAMIRIFFFVFLAGLVALGGGVLMLGMFPPNVHQQTIEKVVPNDKFAAH
jgi:hypothetical protein